MLEVKITGMLHDHLQVVITQAIGIGEQLPVMTSQWIFQSQFLRRKYRQHPQGSSSLQMGRLKPMLLQMDSLSLTV
jgi:hypothetical protein